MDETTRIQYTLKLLLLLSGNIRYTIPELAERLGKSERSIQRHIQAFRNAGIVIPKPVNGRYWAEKNMSGIKELSDLLHFSEEEAYILTRAIHSIDDVNVLKSNLVKKLYALYDFDRVVETIVKKENSENVHNLIKAIRNKECVLLRDYQSANSNLVRDRLVEPFDFCANYISVWAFDPESRENKTFKTARISKVEFIGKAWQFENLHEKLPVDVFRISSKETINVILNLGLRACNLLTEEYPLSEKYIEQINDNLWQFKGPVCGFEGIGRFVCSLCDEIEIVEPQGLQEYVKEKMQKFLHEK